MSLIGKSLLFARSASGCPLSILLSLPTKYVGNMTIALRTLECTLADRPDTTLLIDEDFEALVRLCLPSADRLLCYPRRTLANQSMTARLVTYVNFIRKLRAIRYSQLLDLDGTVVSGTLAMITRAEEKLAPSFAKRPGRYDRLVDITREQQHCFDDYRQMVQVAGINVSPDSYLTIPAQDSSRATLSRLGSDAAQPYVCLHPSATKDYKQWHTEGFCQLANQLLANGWQVIVIGAGQSEVARVEAIESATRNRVINAHNQLSLFDLIAVLQNATFFVGNDSGPMHYAAACGTHVFAIFGPTELIRWEPKVERHTIIKGPEPCHSRCQPEDCKRAYQCMKSLQVQHVTSAIAAAGFKVS